MAYVSLPGVPSLLDHTPSPAKNGSGWNKITSVNALFIIHPFAGGMMYRPYALPCGITRLIAVRHAPVSAKRDMFTG